VELLKNTKGREDLASISPEVEKGIKKNWHLVFLVFRPWSFFMTGISIMIGSLMALLRQDQLNLSSAILALLGVTAIHASANILNDYFDTLYGIDKPGTPTTFYRPHPLIDKILTPREVVFISVGLNMAAVLVGVYFIILRGWTIAVIAAIGAFAGIAYTAEPVKYKYRCLGELVAFSIWGPLMTFGAYFVQTGNWSDAAAVFFISIPLGILVALVLLANNLRDVQYDIAAGIKTVATWLGKEKALKLFAAMVFIVYMFNCLGILLGFLPVWAFLVFLSVPQALRLVNSFIRGPAIPQNADPQTGRYDLTYGALLILSLIVESFLV
jgi:1,4-dihydroxy-2-naphthoate octaprenyltransferase